MKKLRSQEFRIRAELESLYTTRTYIREFLGDSEFSNLDKNRILVSIDEILANIIEHGTFSASDSFIQIKLQIDGNLFFADIMDESKIYDPTQYQSIDPETYLKEGLDGGMGIHNFMRLMDVRHSVRLDKKGNHLSLRYPKAI
jgi:serine/threonine-protein kinase RsbW